MKTLFIQGGVTRIRQRGDLLMIKKGGDDAEGGETRLLSPAGLEHITLAGNHSISTGAISLIARHGGVITLLDSLGHPVGQLLPFEKTSVIDNYETQISLNQEKRLELAKIICAGSLGNRMIFLKKVMHKTGYDLSHQIHFIQEAMNRIPDCMTPESLRGIEGSGAHAYFEGFTSLIPEKWNFSGREKHPARDPVNALLSYGYGILYTRARTSLVSQGLSPYYGVFHESYRHQEALVYDFVEEFRQVIVDRVVMTFINRRHATPSDFTRQNDGSCLISDQVRKKFVRQILQRLESKARGTSLTYADHINHQATLLASAIMNRENYRPFLYR